MNDFSPFEKHARDSLFVLRACAGMVFATLFLGCGSFYGLKPEQDGAYHVRPGQSIQQALDAAARDESHKKVIVHEGVYRPHTARQAMIWFTERHDGVTLEAKGEVVLTAANQEIAVAGAKSFPAVVTHVVHFGDGINEQTILRGFKITGANHFVTQSKEPEEIEQDIGLPKWRKAKFFRTDGGAIKIFGRSYPTIERVEIYDNYASPCGGGVSIEHCGYRRRCVTLRDCIFRNNRCQVTGSAVDVLPGSFAVIENCLFVGNVANTGEDPIGTPKGPYNGEHGSGALTVFHLSRAKVLRCTFTGNWNGADDKGLADFYEDCIFWQNTKSGGICPGKRYELDILDPRRVTGCFLSGEINDLRGGIDPKRNTLGASDPQFDSRYIPQNKEYAKAGYRPVSL